MSVPTDDPSFLQNLLGPNGSLNSGLGSGLMGLAAGLLGAGGPSRMPVSLGQALGQGLQTGQQFQSYGLQNAMQRLMLGQNMYGMQALNDAYGNGGGAPPVPAAFSQYAPAPSGNSQAAPATSGGSSPQVTPATSPSNTPQVAPASSAPNQPQPAAPPWLPQVSKDNAALNALSRSPKLKDQADQLRNRMQNTWFPMTPDMVKQQTGDPPVPGIQYYVNEMGEPKQVGESNRKVVSVMTPRGVMAQVPYDQATNKVDDVGHVLDNTDYSQPLKSNYLENLAHRLATFQAPATAVSSRDPGVADAIARADYLNKDIGGFDQTTYGAKQKAMQSLSSGKDYQQNLSYSTIQTHMDTLKDAYAANDAGDYQDVNKLLNWSGRKVGKSAPQNVQVVNDIVTGELAKVLAQGGQVTDAVRAEAKGDLEPYLSKGQFQGAVGYIQNLIAGKMNSSYIGGRANHIPDDVLQSYWSPEARQQLDQFRATHPDQFSPQSQTGAAQSSNTGNWVYDPSTGTMKQQ